MLVPGTGKIYAGATGQGIAAFIMVGMLGGITAETYIKSGPKNPQFIIMGSLFTVFYIGNIYGSVFSVKIANEKYNDEVKKILLFNMRIPVSRIFSIINCKKAEQFNLSDSLFHIGDYKKASSIEYEFIYYSNSDNGIRTKALLGKSACLEKMGCVFRIH